MRQPRKNHTSPGVLTFQRRRKVLSVWQFELTAVFIYYLYLYCVHYCRCTV